MMDVLMVISFFGLPISLILFGIQALRKKQKSKKIWGSLTVLFAFMIVISATSSLSEKQDSSSTLSSQGERTVAENVKDNDSFSFSESDENLLSELGFTDIKIEDITENGKMRIITAKVFGSDDLQLNITQEDDTIIYVQLAGIVEDNDVVSNRSDKLDLDVGLQGQKTVDMYSDTDGGILAVLNWQDKTIRKAN